MNRLFRFNRIKNDSLKNKMLWLIGTARNTVVVGLGLVVARIVAAADEDENALTDGNDVFTLVKEVPAGLPKPAGEGYYGNFR